MLANYLAEIWGISIVVISLALLIKPEYLKKLFAAAKNETTAFVCGAICFLTGLAMVLAYNVWNGDWKVIITILGWLALIRGLLGLFMPEFTIKMIKKIEEASFLPYVLVVAVLIGLVITYLGFTATA